MVMASSQDNFGILDQSIPLWKRELILRRRANTRTLAASSNSTAKLACPSQTAVRQAESSAAAVEKPQRNISTGLASNKDPLDQDDADFHPRVRGLYQQDSPPSTAPSAAVANNMRLVEVEEGDAGLVVNGIGGGVDTNGSVLTCSVKYRSRMVEERSSKKSSVSPRTIMDNSAVHVSKVRVGKNNNCDHADNEECSSDSSEELQYGPGIVNRLKSKYLSLALRETQNRPSLSNIRRYSSLENILDNDLETGKPQITNQLATYRKKADAGVKAEHRFRTSSRSSRKDSMKRARSVETLHRYDSRFNHIPNEGLSFPFKPCPQDVNKNRPTSMINPLVNEEVVIIENKMKMEPKKCESKSHAKEKAPLAPQKNRIPQTVPVEKELPPPDAVKQKLRIFESSQKPDKPVKTFASVNKVQSSVNMHSVSAANIPKTNVSHHTFPKPALSPKPNILLDKSQCTASTSPASPRKLFPGEDYHSGASSPTSVPRPNVLHVEPATSSPTTPDVSPASRRKLKSPSPVPTIQSPRAASPVQRAPAPAPPAQLQSRLTNGESPVGHTHVVLAEDSSSEDETDGKAAKKVSKSALENIRKDGASTSFSFGGDGNVSDKPKSYLPSARTLPRKPPVTPPAPASKPGESLQAKQVGVIRPMLSGKPQPASPSTQLTSQEAEKNLINRVKSIEQPGKKVVVPVAKPRSEFPVAGETIRASGASSEVSSAAKAPGLWDKKKPWNQQQNTMVFNFSGTKNPVPDYIENDGVILRSKRQKPKAGESGIILLGASADESSDFDTEEDRLVQLGPPSPCNVVFEGANVLIKGRSSMARQPRDRKFRITFSDVLTSTFEYPSESSLLEDQPAATPATPLNSTGLTPSPLGGSSLASYTPSKVQLGAEDFQLGITRTAPAAAPQPAPAPSLDLYELDEEETYLKPAQDGDTVAWSAETAADLLF